MCKITLIYLNEQSFIQVWSVLESLDRDYKRDEDWCGTDRVLATEKANYLLQLINKHNEQKEAFLKVGRPDSRVRG